MEGIQDVRLLGWDIAGCSLYILHHPFEGMRLANIEILIIHLFIIYRYTFDSTLHFRRSSSYSTTTTNDSRRS